MRSSDRVVVLSAGPATRPIGDFKVDLPRPRDVSEIRMTPAFLDLHREIWGAMKEEVLKAYQLAEGGLRCGCASCRSLVLAPAGRGSGTC